MKKGDYVLATKYRDGDPQDHWAVGFFAGMLLKISGNRYEVVDADGKLFRERLERTQVNLNLFKKTTASALRQQMLEDFECRLVWGEAAASYHTKLADYHRERVSFGYASNKNSRKGCELNSFGSSACCA